MLQLAGPALTQERAMLLEIMDKQMCGWHGGYSKSAVFVCINC